MDDAYKRKSKIDLWTTTTKTTKKWSVAPRTSKEKNRQQALKEVTIQRQDIDGTTTTMQKRSYDIEALSLITKKNR